MEYLKGKGAQLNVSSKFLKNHIDTEDVDGLDEALIDKKPLTKIFTENPKKIISTNTSPDIGMFKSLNPYQGCEHGCIYCFARNTHEYWGFSAGLDFETNIIIKPNAPKLLEDTFLKKGYNPTPFMLSGNTDCYQPIEKKYKITRELLKVCLKYMHPVSIITKNALILRDLDILSELAKNNLIHVFFSITTEDESLRRVLEPRTASASKKFDAMAKLSSHKVPVGVMNAPIIPSLNHHEIPSILRRAAKNGAMTAAFTVVRLNGQIGLLFEDWMKKNFPDRADKVLNQIKSMHSGKLNDSQFGRRIKGEGEIAEIIRKLFSVSRRKYFDKNVVFPDLVTTKFRRGGNYSLF